MPVVEDQLRALALDDQGIERREDMHQSAALLAPGSTLRCGPMLLLAGAFERDRHQFAAAHAAVDLAPTPFLFGASR